MEIVDKCIYFIRKLLQPQHCYLCDNLKKSSLYDICKDCVAELPYKNQSCSRCALAMDGFNSPVCGGCIRQAPSYDVLLSPFEYYFPIDKLITELKFRQKLYHAHTLGHLFSHYITEKAMPLPECLIPVPLHPKRLQQRGYNQSLEIARVVSKNLKIPIDRTLCARIKNTKPQSGLDANARHDNIKNAFQIMHQHSYKHVAIIDDVVTTGHTVEVLAKLLRQNNINVIQVWSIARVNRGKSQTGISDFT